MSSPFKIVEVGELTPSSFKHCDFSFQVSATITPPFDKSLESDLHVTTLQTSYNKQYNLDEETFSDTDPETPRYLATFNIDGRVRGYVAVEKIWNNIASLEDIAIDRSLRGVGVGKALIQHAIEWAKRQGLPALRAETQSNNVAACKLYQRCGFRFGGYDEYLYMADPNLKDETALYWYYIVEGSHRIKQDVG